MKVYRITKQHIKPFVSVFSDHRGNPAVRVGGHFINVILTENSAKKWQENKGATTCNNFVFAHHNNTTLLLEKEEFSNHCLLLSDGKVISENANQVLCSEGEYLTVVAKDFCIKGSFYEFINDELCMKL